jgi:glycosyltransferase involved in cell wall biosynthesis
LALVRILILVDCYLPSTKSSAILAHDIALEFATRQHEVTVLTPSETALEEPHVLREGGIELIRVNAGSIKGAPLWLRGINEARLSARIWSRCSKLLLERHFDLVVFYSPTIFFGGLIARLKRQYGCRTYLILRDIFPQWAFDAGILRNRILFWYLKHAEYRQYGVADVIGVQSPANLEYFRERHLDRLFRLEVLYNWMRIGPVPSGHTSHRAQWQLQGKIVLFYGGNLGVAQDCDNLLRLAAGLLKVAPEAHLLLVGEGSELSRLRRVVAEEHLDNVTIRDALPQTEYLDLVSEIDIGLISLDRKLRTQNFPGKLLSYMYAAKPILASINPGNDLKDLLETTGSGLVCINGSDHEFLSLALKLIRDSKLRQSMGGASRVLLEKQFSSSAAADQILRSASVK